MKFSQFLGIRDLKELTSNKFNRSIQDIRDWWNDHNAGVRIWDNANVNTLVVNTKATVPNGVNPTDAAAFGQIGTPITTSDWVSYTPTITGCGTVSAVSFFWKQIDKTIFVRGYWTSGTVAASAISVTLPNSTTINGAHVETSGLLGASYFNTAGVLTEYVAGRFGMMFYDGSTTNKVFEATSAASGLPVKDNGNVPMGNGDSVSVDFSYPI